MPFPTGGAGSTPGCGAKTPGALGPKNKTENRNNIVTNSMKTLKMVHIKKRKEKKYWKEKKKRNLKKSREGLSPGSSGRLQGEN